MEFISLFSSIVWNTKTLQTLCVCKKARVSSDCFPFRNIYRLVTPLKMSEIFCGPSGCKKSTTMNNGVYPKWNGNSMISENLINNWNMNWGQFKNPLCHISLAGAVVVSWSQTQEVASLNSFAIRTTIFATEFNENIYGKFKYRTCYEHLLCGNTAVLPLITGCTPRRALYFSFRIHHLIQCMLTLSRYI